MEVLFINNNHVNCGVYQYGLQVLGIVSQSEDLVYIYKEVDNYDQYIALMKEFEHCQNILYNYHPSTLFWLNEQTIIRRQLNTAFIHENVTTNKIFDFCFELDPTAKASDKVIPIPRPLISLQKNHVPKLRKFIDNHQGSGIPIFGSFGFCFLHKGYQKIVEYVNAHYDEAVIKLILPPAHYDSSQAMNRQMVTEQCKKFNVKPGIRLEINHGFYDLQDIMCFLRSNTLNIFLYNKNPGAGISSAIDILISAGAPFAISDSYMFRHIYNDNICLDKSSVDECIKNSLQVCRTKSIEYSHDNMRKVINTVFATRSPSNA